MKEKLLSVRDLSVSFAQYGKGLRSFVSTPISSLNVEINRGEIHAIVGASGSGKSLLAHAVMDILPPNAIVKGEISYKGRRLDKKNIASLRGKEIAFIPQSVNYLDPSMKVKNQVKLGMNGTKEEKRKLQEGLFLEYGLKKSHGELYPYQLSGGMLRRVLFATCIRQGVELIIADEPTPGIHKEALDMVLKQLRSFADNGMGVMLITHDIISAIRIADYISVFKDGENIETAPSAFFSGGGEQLREEYTRRLWLSLPQNEFLKGEVNGVGG